MMTSLAAKLQQKGFRLPILLHSRGAAMPPPSFVVLHACWLVVALQFCLMLTALKVRMI